MRRTPLLVIGLTLCVAVGGRRAAAQAPQAPDGQALYQKHCRACHGVVGAPPKNMMALYKNLRAFDSTFLAKRSEDSVVAVLKHGAGRDMKSFKDKLTPEQMVAVAKYVRTLGSAAPKAP